MSIVEALKDLVGIRDDLGDFQDFLARKDRDVKDIARDIKKIGQEWERRAKDLLKAYKQSIAEERSLGDKLGTGLTVGLFDPVLKRAKKFSGMATKLLKAKRDLAKVATEVDRELSRVTRRYPQIARELGGEFARVVSLAKVHVGYLSRMEKALSEVETLDIRTRWRYLPQSIAGLSGLFIPFVGMIVTTWIEGDVLTRVSKKVGERLIEINREIQKIKRNHR